MAVKPGLSSGYGLGFGQLRKERERLGLAG